MSCHVLIPSLSADAKISASADWPPCCLDMSVCSLSDGENWVPPSLQVETWFCCRVFKALPVVWTHGVTANCGKPQLRNLEARAGPQYLFSGRPRSWHSRAPDQPQPPPASSSIGTNSSSSQAGLLPHTMLSMTLRSRSGLLAARRMTAILRAYSTSTEQVPANDPNPPKIVQNVSATNAVPTSAEGIQDAALQESVEKGEELRIMQAPNRQSPNRKGIWSRSQQPREVAMTGPRFEQTIFADQVGNSRLSTPKFLEGRWLGPHRD